MPEPTTVLLELWRVSRLAGTRLDEALASTSMTASDFALYSVLRFHGPVTPTVLARHAGTPVTTTSQALRRLEDRGHLVRRDNPDDARSQLVGLNAAGRAAHRRAGAAFAPVLEEVTRTLGEDLEVVLWSLERLERALGASGLADADPDGPVLDASLVHRLLYTGPVLSDDEADEVQQFVNWLRHRAAGAPRTARDVSARRPG